MKRFLAVLVALVILGAGVAEAGVLTATELKQLEDSGPQWADITTYGGYGCADRLSQMDNDGTYLGSSSYRIVVIGGAGDIAANDLVYISGFSTTYPTVLKADADAIATMRNLYFCPDAITAGEEGYAYKREVMDGQDTDSATVGDPVYASCTAGEWTLTKPSGAGDIVQEIGVVIVKSATVGQIDVDIGGGPESSFEIKTLTALAAAPAIDDLFTLADESVAGDPTKSITLQYMMNGVDTLVALAAAPAITDSVFLNDGGVAKKITIQYLFDGIAGFTSFAGEVVEATDQIFIDDAGTMKRTTVQVLFDGIDDFTALAAAPDLTDKLLLGDAGTAKNLTIQYLFDGANGLAAEAVVNGDFFMLIDSTGVAKKEAIADLATLLAGSGLSADSSVLSTDLNTLAGGTVDTAADSMVFLDATAASVTKTTTIQHFYDGVDDLAGFTGVVVPGTDSILFIDGGTTAKVSTVQVLFDGVQDLVAFTGEIVEDTDGLLILDGGVAELTTVQVLFDGVGDLDAGAIAATDTLLMIDTGDGTADQETIDDIATLLAGTGLTATNAVIAVDTTQALETISGTDLSLNSTNAMTLEIGTVDILQIDDAAITFAAVDDVAGQDAYVGTEKGGTATTGTAGDVGGLLNIKTGDGSTGCSTENQNGAAGGALTIITGAGGAAGLLVGGTADGADGGALAITGGVGGEGGAGAGGEGGIGGAITLTGGTGGGGTTEANGGKLTLTAGSSGGAGGTGGELELDAGAANGGTAGAINIGDTLAESVGIGRATKVVTILGNAAAINGIVGNDTDLDITAKAGATDGYPLTLAGGAGTGAGNDGGLITVTSGAGVAAAAGTGGPSGAITIATGAPGTETTGTAGLSGTLTLNTGTGAEATGAAGIGGASGPINIQVGVGGEASSVGDSGDGGAGGALTLYAGTGGASDFANQGDGGSVTIRAGAGDTNGSISIGATNAASIGIGAADITTTITGIATVGQDDADAGINDALALLHTASDAAGAAIGDGIGITFDQDNSANTVEEWGSIKHVATNITDTTEDSDFVFRVMLGGATQPSLTIDASDQSVTVGQNVTDTDGIDKLRIFPLTTARGSLVLQAALSAGDTVTTITNASQAAERAYTIPDTGAAASEFLMTDRTKTKWSFVVGGANGMDTDGAGTNGGGVAGGSGIDIATNMWSDGAGTVFCKVYDLTSTTWDDLKTSALLSGGADWTANYQLLPDADAEEAGDAFAVGFATPFCEICFDDLATNNGTLAVWGTTGGKWQYSTGAAAWSDLTVFDNTDGGGSNTGAEALEQTGAICWVPPADWAVATYDGQEAYWVQYVVTAAQLTTTPLIDDTNKDEPMVVVPVDTAKIPYKCNISSVRVVNQGATVHNQNIIFALMNFTKGTYSLPLTWAASQHTDVFTTTVLKAASAGVDCDAGDVIGIVIENDTASTVNPTAVQVELDVTLTD